MGQSTPGPSILQGVMTEHVRRGGGHQSLVEGGGGDSELLPGFQKFQREKQTKISPSTRNKGKIRGQEGQGRRGRVLKVLTGIAGLSLAHRRLECFCPSTLHTQPSLPIDHT